MASTKVTPAEETRRIRAFCRKHGIKFTLVPGKPKPWAEPEPDSRPVMLSECSFSPMYLALLETTSEDSFRNYFDDCGAFADKLLRASRQRRKARAVGTAIGAHLAMGRAALESGDLAAARTQLLCLALIRAEPDVDLGRQRRGENSRGGKKAAGARPKTVAARNVRMIAEWKNMQMPERERAGALAPKYGLTASQIRRIIPKKSAH